MPTSVEHAMQADQASFLLNLSLPTLENEHRLTATIFRAIPLDKGDFRPDPVAKTALELTWHMIAAEDRFLSAVVHGGFDYSPLRQPESLKNSSDLAANYDERFEQIVAQLKQLSGEQLIKIIDFHNMFQLPAVAFIGFHMHHLVHHRGQLSMYLRPMGAKVPSMYGESFDASEARKAASMAAN